MTGSEYPFSLLSMLLLTLQFLPRSACLLLFWKKQTSSVAAVAISQLQQSTAVKHANHLSLPLPFSRQADCSQSVLRQLPPTYQI